MSQTGTTILPYSAADAPGIEPSSEALQAPAMTTLAQCRKLTFPVTRTGIESVEHLGENQGRLTNNLKRALFPSYKTRD